MVVLYRCSLLKRLIKQINSDSSKFSTSFCKSCMVPMETKNEQKDDVQSVKEGKAEVLLPKSVFYNPVQEFNRDLTVAIISQYSREKFQSKLESSNENSEKGDCKRGPGEIENNSVKAGETENNPLKVGEAENNPVKAGEEEIDGFKTLKPGVSYENGIRIFEGLAASGLRSVRFGLEVPGVKEVIANDFDQGAVEFIRKNIEKNNLQGLMKSNYGDAAMIMYQNKGFTDRFDVIDLDPYGSPSHFLDSAVQAVKDDGLLCITCTDMAVLCGVASETCYAKYGAVSLKAKYCHEMALRIVLQSIESHANRYSRYIVPVLALSVDFYVRVFLKVYTGASKVKQSLSKMAMVYNCVGCGSYSLQNMGSILPAKGDNFKYAPSTGPPVSQKCEHCGFRHQLGGPIWANPIHDASYIDKVIQYVEEDTGRFNTSKRIIGMLSMMKEELQDVPLYYILDELCKALHCTTLTSNMFRSAILNAGYRVSMSHAGRNSVKTDAPNKVIWDILRAWIKDNPVKEKRKTAGSVVERILSSEPTTDVSFEEHAEANPESRQKGLLRWQVNPEKDWGPKARAKRGVDNESLTQRKLENQGKRSKKRTQDDENDENTNVSQHPCKFFKSGHCSHGDDCKYSHDVMSEPTI